jgi:hypothetical protein
MVQFLFLENLDLAELRLEVLLNIDIAVVLY